MGNCALDMRNVGLDVRFDAENLASNLECLFNNRDGNAADAKLFKLLADIDDILSNCGIAAKTTIQTKTSSKICSIGNNR